LRGAAAGPAEATPDAPAAPAPPPPAPTAAGAAPGAGPAPGTEPATGPGGATGLPVTPDSPTVRYVRPAAADAGASVGAAAPERRGGLRPRRAGLAVGAATVLVAASAAALAGMWRRAVPHELEVSPPDAVAEEVLDATPMDVAPLADSGAATASADSGSGPSPADTVPAGLAAGAGSAARRPPPIPRPRPHVDTELGGGDEESLRVLEVRVLGQRHPEPPFLGERVSYLLVEARNRSTWPIRTIAGRIVLRDRAGELLKTLHLQDGRLLPPGGTR